MAQGLTPLNRHPEYKNLITRYAFDLERFSVEVFGCEATQHQSDLYKSVQGLGSRTSVSSGHGCFGLNTKIKSRNGEYVLVQDIAVGDKLMGDDNKSSRNVKKLYRDRERMYRFNFESISPQEFNESHILCLYDHLSRDYIKLTVKKYLEHDEAGYLDAYCFKDGGRELIKIISIDSLGEGDYYGFELDGNNLFLGDDDLVLSNTGKTFSYAIIALWHLITYELSNTFITAPKLDTVKDGIWKEFADHRQRMIDNGFGWLAEYVVIEHKKVFVKDFKLNWYIIPKTAPKGSPENLAGTHRTSLMWIADEASGIPDANFGIIGGAMTGGDRNRFVIASQPTRGSGYFYNTHHSLSKANGGVWTALVFNSEESPMVSDAFLREKVLEYGGRNSPEYSIKVLGRFPDKTEGMLLGRSEIEGVFGESCIRDTDEWGWMLTSDVGGGGFRDSSTLMLAQVVGYGDFENPEDDSARDARRIHIHSIPLYTNAQDEIQFSGSIYNYLVENRLISENIMMDRGGGGSAVEKLLELKGVPMITGVRWGDPCFKKDLKDRFVNQRAQCNWFTARAVREGRLTISPDLSQTVKARVLDEGSRLPYFWNEHQKIQMAKKEDMKKDGIPSPDLWDSIAQLSLEGAHYSVASNDVSIESQEEQFVDRANKMFEGMG